MAAIRRGNSIYADGNAEAAWDYPDAAAPYDYSQNAVDPRFQIKNVLITKVVLTATTGPANVLITDGGNDGQAIPPAPIINLSVADGDTTVTLDFDPPLQAPNGLIVESLTDGVVQLTIGVAR